MRYAAAEVKAYLGWEQKGILVSGEDESGHWGNLPRPQGPLRVIEGGIAVRSYFLSTAIE